MNPNPKIKKIKELSYAQQEGSAKPIHTQQSKSNATKKNTITVITHHTHTKSRNTNSKPNAKLTMKKAYTRRSVFPPELTSRKRERERSRILQRMYGTRNMRRRRRERERGVSLKRKQLLRSLVALALSCCVGSVVLP